MTKSPPIGDNSKARAATIVDVCRQVSQLESKRKVIGEEIRKIKNKQIKGDLGMKVVDFNVAYRLYQLEDEARDQLLDTVRETFKALGVGEQLDWLKASERVAAVVPSEEEKKAERKKELDAAK